MKLLIDKLLEFENGELEAEKEVALFQDLIDTGRVWRLQGSYGRTALELIKAGLCMLGERGFKDYYGTYVPSRYEVRPGTIGSPEFVAEHGSNC